MALLDYIRCLSVTLVINAYTYSCWNAICTVQYSHVRCVLSLRIAELLVCFSEVTNVHFCCSLSLVLVVRRYHLLTAYFFQRNVSSGYQEFTIGWQPGDFGKRKSLTQSSDRVPVRAKSSEARTNFSYYCQSICQQKIYLRWGHGCPPSGKAPDDNSRYSTPWSKLLNSGVLVMLDRQNTQLHTSHGKWQQNLRVYHPSSRALSPLSSTRQHLSYDGCLEVRGEVIRTVLFCAVLCNEVVHSRKHT